jgi:predicted MFS family arabinose efflux permease
MLIQALTAPFAIALDALSFLVSAAMLRRVHAPLDVRRAGPAPRVTHEIVEGLQLVRRNPTLWALAWVAGLWQVLHHMQLAVLILFATRELGLSAGAIGLAYMFGGIGCVLAAASAERLSKRYGIGQSIMLGLVLTAVGWQIYGLVSGPPWFAMVALGLAMLLFDFGGVLWGINYLALRQAITPDRLLGRMTATMRFLTVASAPLGSLAGGALATLIGLRPTLLTIGALGLALAAVAQFRSPVRQHRELPVAASD